MSIPASQQHTSPGSSASRAEEGDLQTLQDCPALVDELKREFLQAIAAPAERHLREQKRGELVARGLVLLRGLSQAQQWEVLRRELALAAQALLRGQSLIFWSLDETPRGGQHHVVAFLDLRASRLRVEIPAEPADPWKRGGRFPTVLHTLELVVATIRHANELAERRGGAAALPYPAPEFAARDGDDPLATLRGEGARGTLMFIPLTIDSAFSNVLILQPNARGSYLSPSDIACGYYHVLQRDGELLSHLLRHTMLVRPRASEKGRTNRDVQVGVLPKAASERDFDLSDLGRLREWRAPTRREVTLWEAVRADGLRIHGFTLCDQPGTVLASSPAVVGPDDDDDEEEKKGVGAAQTRKPRAAVVGAGVIGLTTAILAQEAGYQVTIYADRPPAETTSMVAGATFAPYAVPLTPAVIAMVEDGWECFAALARETGQTGVRRVTYWEIESQPFDLGRLPYLHVMQDVQVHECPTVPGGYAHGVRYGTFLVDMHLYLPYLLARFRAHGGTLVRRRFANLHELARLPAELVFHCSGLGARELAGDESVLPLKGQLAIIGPRPDLEWAIKHDGFYAFPQPQTGRTVLGGTVVENGDACVEPGVTQTIVNGNKRVLPGLCEADVRQAVVGLRPYRKGDVRVEAVVVDGSLIIHNYGHGGAGVTLSWGSGKLALGKR